MPAVTPLTRDAFDGGSAERRLAEYFAVATTQAFGTFSRLELTAAAACVTYLERTQRGEKPLLSPPARESGGATLLIDAATRANLELVRTSSGERRGSLLSAIDRTVTAAGSRLLAQRLAAPLTAPSAIGERLDSVAALVAAAGAILRRSATLSWRPRKSPARAGRSIPVRPRSPPPRPRCKPPIRRAPPRSLRRLPTSCRASSATADSSAPATAPGSTRRGRCATSPAASLPCSRPAMPRTPAFAR